jgi:hypothetical protein
MNGLPVDNIIGLSSMWYKIVNEILKSIL